MWFIKPIVALIIFIFIQVLTEKHAGITTAIVANIPIFTLFAFSIVPQTEVKSMSLNLAVMTGIISVSYLIIYFIKTANKNALIAVFLGSWIFLTIIAYFLLKGVRG